MIFSATVLRAAATGRQPESCAEASLSRPPAAGFTGRRRDSSEECIVSMSPPCRNAAQCSGRQHSLGLAQTGARRGVLGTSGRWSFHRVRRGGASRAVAGGSSAISCGDFSAPLAAFSATDAGSRGMRSGQKGLELEECVSLAIESIGLTRVPTGSPQDATPCGFDIILPSRTCKGS